MDDVPQEAHSDAHRDVRRAWLANLLFVPSAVAAFVVGEGLFTLVGGDQEATAWWQPLVAGVPALVVFALPCLVVGWFARRAARAGLPGAYVPLLVALVIAAGFGGLNLLSLAVQLV